MCATPRRNRRAAQAPRAADRGLGDDGRGLGNNRLGRMRLSGRVAADAALATLFDHDLLGAAVAEALAYGARLDTRLERQVLLTLKVLSPGVLVSTIQQS